VALSVRLVDEFDDGLGWICDEPVARTSHALRAADGVWLVDPVAPSNTLLQAIAALGEVRGVIQLLDRHDRDCAALAHAFAVPHLTPFASNSLLRAPFETVRVAGRRWWREVALWWPERRVLVCADALGTVAYFRAPGEAIGVHPLLRLTPPRRLRGLEPERILVGHGRGVHDGAAGALQEALATSRRRAVAAVAAGLRRRRRGSDM
jgi:glyoxylase-like metal-dependent hydrolase (beta-lactamase superfamily II)